MGIKNLKSAFKKVFFSDQKPPKKTRLSLTKSDLVRDNQKEISGENKIIQNQSSVLTTGESERIKLSVVESVTILSMFDDNPNSEKSEESVPSTCTVLYTDEKINLIIRQYIDEHGDELTEEMVDLLGQLFHDATINIHSYGLDYQRKILEPSHIRRFTEVMPTDEKGEFSHLSNLDRIIRHKLCMVHTFQLLLHLYQTNEEAANDLLKQIAVSHALMKITSEDFRVMNVRMGIFLLRQNLMHDENMPPVVTFFNKAINCIIRLYESKELRTVSRSDENHMGKFSKPRENYRTMKRWKETVKKLREETGKLNSLFEQETAQQPIDEDDVTLDTQTLKERHWLFGKCTKNRNLNNAVEEQGSISGQN